VEGTAESGSTETVPDPARAKSRARAEVETVLRGGGGESVQRLPSTAQLATQDYKQDIDLKAVYARWLRWMLIGQLAFADLVFFIYAWAGVGWNVPTAAINVWLGATLIEVVGIVLVVVRYLFPRRDGAAGSPQRT
jgi:hypothetical protein